MKSSRKQMKYRGVSPNDISRRMRQPGQQSQLKKADHLLTSSPKCQNRVERSPEIKQDNSNIKTVVLCQCSCAQKAKNQRNKIKDAKYQMQLLSKQVIEVQQEIYLLLSNFNYIIELTAANIVRECREQLKKIFQEKNHFINEQNQKIKSLTEINFRLEVDMDQRNREILQDNLKLKEKSEKLVQQIQTLKEENDKMKLELLRGLSSRMFLKQNQEACRVTTDSSEKIMKIISEGFEPNELDNNYLNRRTKIKKRMTLVENAHVYRDESEKQLQFGQKIKSLGDIRQKIHRLKKELSRGIV